MTPARLYLVLVCGGRGYTNRAAVFAALDELVTRGWDDFMVLSGGARGADTLALEWAAQREHISVRYPARWKKDGKAAGPKRNQRMLVNGAPDLVVAFPGGTGTADMVRRAEAAGVQVWRAGL